MSIAEKPFKTYNSQMKYLRDSKKIKCDGSLHKKILITFIEFLAICKDDVINSICDLYGIKNANRENDYKLLITMLHWLRKVRNACAHNERIYGIIRVKGRRMQPFKEFLEGLNAYTREKDQRIIDLLVYLRYFIEDINYKTFIEEIESMFNGLKDNIEDFPFNRVRKETGIKNIQHLEKLKEYVKNIEYNKF